MIENATTAIAIAIPILSACLSSPMIYLFIINSAIKTTTPIKNINPIDIPITTLNIFFILSSPILNFFIFVFQFFYSICHKFQHTFKKFRMFNH